MTGASSLDPLQALDLTSLDVESLFSALTAVEKTIPVLLACIKPILAQLTSPNAVEVNEDGSQAAKEAIARYTELLDKIQYVLRQTVYYLHQTQVSSNTLRPTAANSIPTPFASTLPALHLSSAPNVDANHRDRESGEYKGVELGLYGKRVEARTLKEMVGILERLEKDGLGTPLGLGRCGMQENTPEGREGGRVDGSMEVDRQVAEQTIEASRSLI